jgi:hypothetical protein
VSPKGAKVSKHDTVETRVFNGWLIKNRGKALSEEIADELVKAFNLVPNFDVSKVGPTKYLRNQVTELYMPQCDTKTVKINGVTVHYVPLDDICREVLATSTEWISQYEEVDDIKHQCNSDGWKEYHKVFSPLFDKGYVPLYPSLWCDGVLIQPSRGLSKTVIQVEFPHLPSHVSSFLL